MEHVIKYFGCRNIKTNEFLFEFFNKTKDEIIDGLRKICPLWSNETIKAMLSREQFYDYNLQHKNDKPIIVKKEIKEEIKTNIVKEEKTKTSSKKSNLDAAKRNKKDEFYTCLEDIENEVKHYKKHFKDKVVYCNCDKFSGNIVSNFYVYFTMNFKHLGLKKLICSYYNEGGHGKAVIFEGIKDPTRNMPNDEDTTIITLSGNGSYNSTECLNFLKESDIVVTNPPFSLFRDYVATLMYYGKKFLIIGNQNAITYKEIFPLIRDNQLWLGISMNGSNRWFQVPNDYIHQSKAAGYKEIDGKKYLFVNNVVWFTNLDNDKRHEEIALYKEYNPTDYPTYDNYEAIECSKVNNIPCDYDGVIGVPITYLHKHNPNQFEIIGCSYEYGDCGKHVEGTIWGTLLNGKVTYKRLFIRRKK